jgi:Na+-transporting methylmalonyl-CoA/oxaloacetate decarboxylase gamma subunit
MQIPLFIATATEDLGHSHSVWDALPHLGGMIMVLITLTVMWGVTAAVAKLITILHAHQAAAAPAPSPAAAPPAASATPVAAIAAAVAATYENEQIVSSEVAAVIAAAVACMSGGSRRVISIRPVDSSWEKAGRQSVLYSHRIR